MGKSRVRWVASSTQGPMWEFVGSVPSSRGPLKWSEGFLAPPLLPDYLPCFVCPEAWTKNPPLISLVSNRLSNHRIYLIYFELFSYIRMTSDYPAELKETGSWMTDFQSPRNCSCLLFQRTQTHSNMYYKSKIKNPHKHKCCILHPIVKEFKSKG